MKGAQPWLGMATGEARYFFHRLMLQADDDGTEVFVNRTGMSITEDFAVTYPGGPKCPMDVGHVSHHRELSEWSCSEHNLYLVLSLRWRRRKNLDVC